MAWGIGSNRNKAPSRRFLFQRSRWQLTVWYTGVMALILSISAMGLYEAIAYAQRVAADRELKYVAETFHNTLEDYLEDPMVLGTELDALPPSLLPNPCILLGESCIESADHHNNGLVNEGYYDSDRYQGSYYLRLFSPEGEWITTLGNAPLLPLPLVIPVSAWQSLQDEQGRQYRQLVLPLYTADEQTNLGTILVGRSFDDFASYLDTIRQIILVSLPVSILLTGLVSWWLAGRAMTPIKVSYRNIQQFTTDAAHELRTPLAAIQATTESVMRLPHISDAEARDMAHVLNRQNQRLVTLVRDLLLLSRLDIQQLESVVSCCLQDILSDIEEELAALALSKDLTLTVAPLPVLAIYVFGNEAQLYRLFLNIVSNAIQYTAPSGSVTLALQQQANQAIVTVRDTGQGMSEADQRHIFDRFYRVDKNRSRQQGGSGLGLSIALAIAHAHHGDIAVESEVGVGSTFTIQLPIQ